MSEELVRFEAKVAVVTGGASGIGRACVLRFAREGAHVAVLDILAEGAATTAREAGALGREALAIPCDVRNEDQLAAAVKLIVNTQNSNGGWRYQPVRTDADISVTICQVMALRAASTEDISTQPKPRDRPERRSWAIRALVTSPC